MWMRVTAAGAVFVACLCFLTAPARACDDRFIKKCEKASAAAFAAEEAASEPSARRAGKRVRLVASRQVRHSRFVKRTRGPRFAVRRMQSVVLASTEDRRAAPADSLMARRFRGFIDPSPIAQNAFEALRKPRAVALDFDAAAILPPMEVAEAAPAVPAAEPPAAAVAPVVTTPKQDRLAAKPAVMELASAESKPVVLPALAPAKPVEAAIAAPVIVSEAPPAVPNAPSPFSIHGLVLALCGALGAASALRFIVGA